MSVSSVCFFPFLAVTGGSSSLSPTGGVWNASETEVWAALLSVWISQLEPKVCLLVAGEAVKVHYM